MKNPEQRAGLFQKCQTALIRLAKQYGRYGYHKVAQFLRIEGWTVNHKKVERHRTNERR